jgi:hypothetical protein
MRDSNSLFRFNHPNDITIGAGRVIYEPAYEAWVLPGGAKTKVRKRAEDVAKAIDGLAAREEALRKALWKARQK